MEQYRPNRPHEKLREAAERITYDAFGEVAAKYGSGYPDAMPATVRELAYHNLQHSWQVETVAGKLAQVYGLNADDESLARMIAAAHDVEHDAVADASAELRSAEWLVRRMQVAGFSRDDLEIACLAIDGTTPLYDEAGNFAGQKYSQIIFPSERAERIARCVAGADMSAAYTNHGPIVAHELFKEYANIGTHEAPMSLAGLEKFQAGQVVFLQNLQPIYPGIDALLGGLREQNIDYHKQLLNELEAGRVTTWEQVEQMDSDYAARWSVNY